jgi:ABC-type transport system substrate-binding protein
VILERNDKYFRRAAASGQAGAEDHRGSADPRHRVEKGEIDFMPFSFLRMTDVERLQKIPSSSCPGKATRRSADQYIEMNLRAAPLDDLRVRQAIAHTIDRNFVTKNLHRGFSQRLDGPLHSSNRSTMRHRSRSTTSTW